MYKKTVYIHKILWKRISSISEFLAHKKVAKMAVKGRNYCNIFNKKELVLKSN